MDYFDRERGGERVLLVQPQAPGTDASGLLSEFSELAISSGALVIQSLCARLQKPNPKYFLGSGKVSELAAICAAEQIELVLVNAALSPIQERNLEAALRCRVLDRTGLILDIFAQRARSHEGKLQVELAQLKHLATRLVRGWTHLERQRGGAIGLRGPGETQLEIDRRLLSARVRMIESRLDKVDVQRRQSRRQRERGGLPVVALVGYTNAGKSTLFNALARADVLVADQLFATLDPTLRRLEGLASGPALLADTVGFVRDLPHDLVAAFRSTLSEVREADLLLHVVDASDPEREQRIGQVNAVLAEIGASEVAQVQVFNKIDRVAGASARVQKTDAGRADRVWLSALSGAGLAELREVIGSHLGAVRRQAELSLPHSAARLRSRLFAAGVVAAEQCGEDGWLLSIEAPEDRIAPLFGLPDGDGDWLRAHLEQA